MKTKRVCQCCAAEFMAGLFDDPNCCRTCSLLEISAGAVGLEADKRTDSRSPSQFGSGGDGCGRPSRPFPTGMDTRFKSAGDAVAAAANTFPAGPSQSKSTESSKAPISSITNKGIQLPNDLSGDNL